MMKSSDYYAEHELVRQVVDDIENPEEFFNAIAKFMSEEYQEFKNLLNNLDDLEEEFLYTVLGEKIINKIQNEPSLLFLVTFLESMAFQELDQVQYKYAEKISDLIVNNEIIQEIYDNIENPDLLVPTLKKFIMEEQDFILFLLKEIFSKFTSKYTK